LKMFKPWKSFGCGRTTNRWPWPVSGSLRHSLLRPGLMKSLLFVYQQESIWMIILPRVPSQLGEVWQRDRFPINNVGNDEEKNPAYPVAT
jgi:hypothetical protein